MRFWLALTGALIFAAGAAVGFAASRGISPAASVGAPPISEAFLDAPAFLVQSEHVYRELVLTEDQRQRLDGLLAAHYRDVSRLRSSLSTLVAELYTGVEALLTKEQRERFREIQEVYKKREIQARVRHEILSLNDLGLSPEQEGKVYPILFDAAFAMRATFKDCREKEKRGEDVSREQMRAMMSEISTRRDARLQEVFSPEQWASYRERKERERKLSGRDRRKGSEKGEKGPEESHGPDKGPE